MKRSTTKLEFLNSGYFLLIGDSCGLLLNYYVGKDSWVYAKAAMKKGEKYHLNKWQGMSNLRLPSLLEAPIFNFVNSSSIFSTLSSALSHRRFKCS